MYIWSFVNGHLTSIIFKKAFFFYEISSVFFVFFHFSICDRLRNIWYVSTISMFVFQCFFFPVSDCHEKTNKNLGVFEIPLRLHITKCAMHTKEPHGIVRNWKTDTYFTFPFLLTRWQKMQKFVPLLKFYIIFACFQNKILLQISPLQAGATS